MDNGRNNFIESALLLVGHGSATNPYSSAPTRRIAAQISAQGGFVQVRAAFLKERPTIKEALREIDARKVYVVPNFAGVGTFTQDVIPRALHAAMNPGELVLCPPVGSHPRIAEIIAAKVEKIIREQSLGPAKTCLLLAGHGSSKPGGASRTAEDLAKRLRQDGCCGSVACAFLEQAPFLKAWEDLVVETNVIAMPLLIAEGLHGREDLPLYFGVTLKDLDATKGYIGPKRVGGKTVWYCRGIGADPEIVDVVREIVAEADTA